jgi:hypothetical protein
MQKEILDLSQALFVKQQKLICNGEHFNGGDAFPWRKIGLNVKQVARLHELRRITHTEPKHDPYAKYGVRVVAKSAQNNWFNVVDKNGELLNQGALKRDNALSLFQEIIDAIEAGTPEGRSIASNYEYPQTTETLDDDTEVL